MVWCGGLAHYRSVVLPRRLKVSIEAGVLYVVATPIGNLGDISARALEVLRRVDYIAAEDTRHTQALLTHFAISTPLISVHEHNERERVPQLLAELQAGKTIALVSDAGTPLISDPGFQLVRAARARGVKTVAVPGPSSVMAALSIAGLPTDRFTFEGFLPAKSAARRKRLEELKSHAATLVFFEASHRVDDTLSDMAELFGAERQAVIARELTKRFEESHGAGLHELRGWLAADPQRRKGEFVIVVQGAPESASGARSIDEHRLLARLLEELPIKRAVRITAEVTGLPRNTLYDLALMLKKSD